MATWTITNDGTDVVLTYKDGATTTHCGSGPVALVADVLAWAADQAAVYDCISTPQGVFFRSPMPAGNN